MAGFTMVLALLLGFSLASVSLVHATDTSPPPIFSFGDSFADVGNNNYLPNGLRADHPYYGIDFPGGVATGRFTNGYNLIDILAQHMGFEQSPPASRSFSGAPPFDEYVKRGLNFASAGSGILVDCGVDEATAKCYNLTAQIASFASFVRSLSAVLGAKESDDLIAKSLFIITTGSADIQGFLLHQLLTNPLYPAAKYIDNMVTTFASILKELYSLGARKFAIVGVPAAGVFPVPRAVAASSPIGFAVTAILNGYTLQFDVAQAATLKELSLTLLPEMKYSVFQTYGAAGDVINDTQGFGWQHKQSPCCGESHPIPVYPYVSVVECKQGASLCSNRRQYVYWDLFNPTQPVYEFSARKFYNGNPTYAFPINLRQLVEDGSSGGGAAGGRKGRAGTRARPNLPVYPYVEHESAGAGVAAGEGRSEAI